MQFVGKMINSVSEFYKDINPSTLSGAIDILVVEDVVTGELTCSPFHVRFGKLQLFRPQDKVVQISINGKAIEEIRMKVGEAGETFFVLPLDQNDNKGLDSVPPEYMTSPLSLPISSPPSDQMENIMETMKDTDSSMILGRLSNPSNPATGFRRAPTSDSELEDATRKGISRKEKMIKGGEIALSDSEIEMNKESGPHLLTTSTITDLSLARQQPQQQSISFSSPLPPPPPPSSPPRWTWMWGGLPTKGTVIKEKAQSDSVLTKEEAVQAANKAKSISPEPNGESVKEEAKPTQSEETSASAKLDLFDHLDCNEHITKSIERIKELKNCQQAEPSYRQLYDWKVAIYKAPLNSSILLTKDQLSNTGTLEELIIKSMELVDATMYYLNPALLLRNQSLLKRVVFILKATWKGENGDKDGGKDRNVVNDENDGNDRNDKNDGNYRNDKNFNDNISNSNMTEQDEEPGQEIKLNVKELESIQQDSVDEKGTMLSKQESANDLIDQLANDPKTTTVSIILTGPVGLNLAVGINMFDTIPLDKLDMTKLIETWKKEEDASKQDGETLNPNAETSKQDEISKQAGKISSPNLNQTSNETRKSWRWWSSSKPTEQATSSTNSLLALSPPSSLALNIAESTILDPTASTMDKIHRASSTPDLSTSFSDGPTGNFGERNVTEGIMAKEQKKEQRYIKALRLPSDQLKVLKLNYGLNTISFSVLTGKQEGATCTARIFLWKSNAKIVISDIDGTITKSDALGHLFTFVGRDWTHAGVAKLYSDIFRNGYKFLYLTSRAIGQANATRLYLRGIEQNKCQLPDGPVIMSPDRFFAAVRRELIEGNPEEFKIACLLDIRRLFQTTTSTINGKENVEKEKEKGKDGGGNGGTNFGTNVGTNVGTNFGTNFGTIGTNIGNSLGGTNIGNSFSNSLGNIDEIDQNHSEISLQMPINPFYAGFGNRINDAYSYRSVGVLPSRIFTINPSGDLRLELVFGYIGSYVRLTDLVDHIFPPLDTGKAAQDKAPTKVVDLEEPFNDFFYWKRNYAIIPTSIEDRGGSNKIVVDVNVAQVSSTSNHSHIAGIAGNDGTSMQASHHLGTMVDGAEIATTGLLTSPASTFIDAAAKSNLRRGFYSIDINEPDRITQSTAHLFPPTIRLVQIGGENKYTNNEDGSSHHYNSMNRDRDPSQVRRKHRSSSQKRLSATQNVRATHLNANQATGAKHVDNRHQHNGTNEDPHNNRTNNSGMNNEGFGIKGINESGQLSEDNETNSSDTSSTYVTNEFSIDDAYYSEDEEGLIPAYPYVV